LPRELLSLCHVLTPNAREAEALGVRSVDDLLAYVTGGVVVTKGGEGSLLFERGKQPVLQAAFPVDVLDTTGAGDTFSAAIACSLARGDSLAEAHRYAAAAAALSTRAAGPTAGIPTDIEVRHLLSAHNAPLGRRADGEA
jgi:ribokinase